MALRTAQKKLDDARKAYERTLKEIGTELKDAIVEALAAGLPEGWLVIWHQSDKQYNDEDYYFGLDHVRLVTEKEPRQGALLDSGRPKRTELAGWGTSRYERVVDYGSPPVYEWILDDQCKTRDNLDRLGWAPGVVPLHKYERVEAQQFELTPELAEQFHTLFDSISERDMRHAFGDEATVIIRRDGTCEVS